jgi:hypothetical protein
VTSTERLTIYLSSKSLYAGGASILLASVFRLSFFELPVFAVCCSIFDPSTPLIVNIKTTTATIQRAKVDGTLGRNGPDR